MKKILLIMNGTISLYRFRKELIEALISEKWQVLASAPDDGLLSELKALGVIFIDTPMKRRGTNPARELGLLLRYRRMLRELRPDVVLTYTIKPNIYGNLAAFRLNIPIISTVTGLGDTFLQNGVVNRIVKFIYRIAFYCTACVVFQNHEDEEILRNTKIVKLQRVLRVMGSGVNLQEHSPLKYPETSGVSFLYIGRIMKAKGAGLLIEAARRLKNEGVTGFSVTFVGYHEGDVRSEVEAAKKEGFVQDAGFQENIEPFVQNAHCVVLPTYYKEGMSNALLEAAAFGRPLIATDISGCREILEDSANGFLCKPRDVDSLYDCMKRFLALSPEQRIKMGIASRRKVEAEFDRRQVVKTMVKEIKRY